MYRRFTQERIAALNALATQAFAAADPQKAATFLSEYMEATFPEMELKAKKDLSVDAKIKELQGYFGKDFKLLQDAEGKLSLDISERKG